MRRTNNGAPIAAISMFTRALPPGNAPLSTQATTIARMKRPTISSRRRQNGDRIDLVERAVAGQRAHLDHRARRRRQVRIEELRAHLAHQRLMRPQVDQILRELDDMLEAAPAAASAAPMFW